MRNEDQTAVWRLGDESVHHGGEEEEAAQRPADPTVVVMSSRQEGSGKDLPYRTPSGLFCGPCAGAAHW